MKLRYKTPLMEFLRFHFQVMKIGMEKEQEFSIHSTEQVMKLRFRGTSKGEGKTHLCDLNTRYLRLPL